MGDTFLLVNCYFDICSDCVDQRTFYCVTLCRQMLMGVVCSDYVWEIVVSACVYSDYVCYIFTVSPCISTDRLMFYCFTCVSV